MLFAASLWAQEVKIELGKTKIALNEPFTIAISIEDGKFSQLSSFPDLEGFRKYGRSTETSTSMNALTGESTTIQLITQSYFAQKEGTYELPYFAMNINDKVIKVEAFTVEVLPANQNGTSTQSLFIDPDDPFFKGEEEVVGVEDGGRDIFLAVSTNKDEVFVGEEFNLVLALYVANSTRRSLQFVELSEQLNTLLRELKPSSCWEEDFNIDRLYPVEVKIDGKTYTQYKLYQASYFPFNSTPIAIPSVKFKMADNNFSKEDEAKYFVELLSNPKEIKVKPLPPHPLKDKVMVGRFYIDEKASELEVNTGESFTYNFAIVGDGNIVNIPVPEIQKNEELDFYPPIIKQVVRRVNNKVTGAKVFGHYVIPKSPGRFALKDYIQFIYFNVATEKYDTLYPQTILNIKGKKLSDQQVNQYGEFYGKLETADDQLFPLGKPNYTKLYINLFLLFILITTFITIFINRRKRKKNER